MQGQDTSRPASAADSGDRVAGDAPPQIPVLTGVRVAAHPGYDRIVFEFDGGIPPYQLEYIDRPVRQCGSGQVVPLPGDAWLQIRLYPANAHTEEGRPSVERRDLSMAGSNLERLTLICDFEAVVAWVAAVESPGGFRTLELANPARLVVDIDSGR